MEWFELHARLPNHHKIPDLADALGVSQAQAVGHLVMLWCWCFNYVKDGNLTGIKPRAIARSCGWAGEPEAFLEGLVEAGWVDRDAGELFVHDWQDYGGKRLKQGAAHAERMRENRSKGERGSGHVPSRKAHVSVTCDERARTCMATGHEITGQDTTAQDKQEGAPAPSRAEEARGDRPKKPRMNRREREQAKAREEFSPEVGALVDRLSGHVEAFTGEAPEVTGDWFVEMDRLLRLDKRSPEDVAATIDYAFTNANARRFWPPNVLKPAKLRKNWETLRGQAIRDMAKAGTATKPKNVSDDDVHGFLAMYSGGQP